MAIIAITELKSAVLVTFIRTLCLQVRAIFTALIVNTERDAGPLLMFHESATVPPGSVALGTQIVFSVKMDTIVFIEINTSCTETRQAICLNVLQASMPKWAT